MKYRYQYIIFDTIFICLFFENCPCYNSELSLNTVTMVSVSSSAYITLSETSYYPASDKTQCLERRS